MKNYSDCCTNCHQESELDSSPISAPDSYVTLDNPFPRLGLFLLPGRRLKFCVWTHLVAATLEKTDTLCPLLAFDWDKLGSDQKRG